MDGIFSLAVHALVYLNHRGGVVSSELLARNICTNPARVRKVMAALKKAGLVETTAGARGGYHLCTQPETLTLAQVAQALGVRFVGAPWHTGDVDMDCLIASGMAGVMEELCDKLDGQCRATLEGITLGDIDRRIFGQSAPGGKRRA